MVLLDDRTAWGHKRWPKVQCSIPIPFMSLACAWLQYYKWLELMGIDLACLTGVCKYPIWNSNAEFHLKDLKSLRYLKNPKKWDSERQSICPFKECTFIKHPLMGFGKSQQGMLWTINTPKRDKNVPLLPYIHHLKNPGSMNIFHCYLER